jgi:hypothetical protein
MGNTPIQPKLFSKSGSKNPGELPTPEPDIVDLSQWLDLNEALALREEMKKPMSFQSLYAMADVGTIRFRLIKGVKCFAREDLLNYVPRRGRPPKEAVTAAGA